MDIDDKEFEKITSEAIDAIPEKFIKGLNNVAIVIEDRPSREQVRKSRGLLFGLYEGIPLTRRTNNYSGVVPDKITIFKEPILMVSRDYEDFVRRVKRTVWHEIAHYYGLGHSEIRRLESRLSKD